MLQLVLRLVWVMLPRLKGCLVCHELNKHVLDGKVRHKLRVQQIC